MPHMMPMMWIMIYFFTLLSLMATVSLFYFFFIPTPISQILPKTPKLKHKWIWLW